MAVVTAPGARRSLLGKVSAALAAAARQHVVTVAALTSVDIGAFHAGPVAGWIVTGVSLLALDFAVTG